MKIRLLTILLNLVVLTSFAQNTKAPSYPLITHDPYFSIWSNTDALNSSPTKHWTGVDHSLIGHLKVDGVVYRFLGNKPETYKNILPAGDDLNYECKYSETKPASNWSDENFDAGHWKTGQGPFGNIAGVSKTMWTSPDIWVLREFTLNDINLNAPLLKLKYDDDIKVFLNGNLIYEAGCCAGKYLFLPMTNEMKSKLKKGKNTFAIHVVNTGGGADLDIGIVEKVTTAELKTVKLAEQKSVKLNATQTIYDFTCGKVNLELTFTSPLLIDELDILARPVSYISAKVKSNDLKSHEVEIGFDASTNIATNAGSEEITASKYKSNGLTILKAGTTEQPILKKKGR